MSNSGIDFFKSKKVITDKDGNIIDEQFTYDFNLYIQTQNELNNIETNKGKFIPFYDDMTGLQLTDIEIQDIADESELRLPYIIIESEKDVTRLRAELLKVNRKHRKYTTKRIVISNKLRREVHERDQGICQICNKLESNQLAHIDRNPAHTWKSNIITLCYDCHLEFDGKKKYSYKEKIRSD